MASSSSFLQFFVNTVMTFHRFKVSSFHRDDQVTSRVLLAMVMQ